MLKYMLDWYDMTDEERSIRDLACEVAEKEIAPRAERHDAEGTFVRDSVDALAEAGLLGANVPKEYGGLGGTPLAAVMALEAVSAACGSTGASYPATARRHACAPGRAPPAARPPRFPWRECSAPAPRCP
jgi:alkylation response protein AidB-like acyl-CoA dehydrogenase